MGNNCFSDYQVDKNSEKNEADQYQSYEIKQKKIQSLQEIKKNSPENNKNMLNCNRLTFQQSNPFFKSDTYQNLNQKKNDFGNLSNISQDSRQNVFYSKDSLLDSQLKEN